MLVLIGLFKNYLLIIPSVVFDKNTASGYQNIRELTVTKNFTILKYKLKTQLELLKIEFEL